MASLSDRLTANKRFEFASRAFGEDKFAVVNMEGTESVSRPFRFELTLVSDDADIDFDAMLQHQATFRIFPADGATPTPYHGILSEFDQLHRADGYVFYRAVLVPRIWRLSLYRMSDLYPGLPRTPDLIKTVLERANFSSFDFEFVTNAAYAKRDFVCQHEESHFSFISRWMERDGIYYYFDHSGEVEKLRIVDARTAHSDVAVEVEYRTADKLDTGVGNKSVQAFVGSQRPLPASVTVQDYYYDNASTTLAFKEVVSATGIGEVILQNENFSNDADGKRYAKLRAEELICASKLFSGESTVVGLRSGFFMKMTQHYREAFNSRYLVTEVEHRGSQAGALLNGLDTPYNAREGAAATFYGNSFQAIPEGVQYRPARVSAWPHLAGTVSATIDSSAGDSVADLDDKGRYLVQLRFQKSTFASGHGSLRIRMASPYAGRVQAAGEGKPAKPYGFHAPLHKGAEVLLSFEGGDPDRPVILGAVANSDNPNIVVGETGKTPLTSFQTPGNGIVMDDTAGHESVTIASKYNDSKTIIGFGGTKGIWQSTSGSSVSLSAGDAMSVSVGEKNTMSVSFDNTFSASFASKFALGTSVNFSAGQDVSWKFGRGITLDDSETVSLKTDGKLQANETVTISGGQRVVVKPMVEALKKKIKWVVGLNTAANLVVAGTAAGLLSAKSDAAGGKLGPWTGWGGGITGAHAALGTISTCASHIVLGLAAKAIADTVKDVAYASNIKVNGDGIDLKVDSIAQETGRIHVADKSVAISVASLLPTLSQSAVLLKPTELRLTGNGMGALTSVLTLNATSAVLETKNPVGDVTLKHAAGPKVKLSADVLQAKGPADTAVTLRATAASLEFASGVGIQAKASKVLVNFSDLSKMELTSSGATLAYGATELKLGAGGATVNGAMIRLG